MPVGRKRKPDVLRQLEGNPGKRPFNGDSPSPQGAVKKPDYVTGHAAEVWKEITDAMPKELYTAADSIILGAFCVAVAQYRSATEEISRDGVTIETGEHGELKAHPALAAQTKALNTIGLLGSRLGLDPTSRASLKMPPPTKKVSKFAGLVNTTNNESGGSEVVHDAEVAA